MDNQIGVFDSGLGGLTVLRSLARELPQENFIYLGDVARLPYGTKSPAVVQRYAERCVDYLVDRGVKAIVVACNTATASALRPLTESTPVPVVGVIAPGAEAALKATRSGRILVAATRSTVESGAYLRAFAAQSPHLDVRQVACPLLVPLAEEGWYDVSITREIVHSYLKDFADFDTCLLGCTHYPLLEAAFQSVLGPAVRVVHGADLLAKQLAAILATRGIARTSPAKREIVLLATDVVGKQNAIPTRLFGQGTAFEVVDL